MSQQHPPREPREPRRARHLIDPANPRPASTGVRGMSLSTVQKWVMSTLAVTTVLHLVAGILIGAAFLDTTRTGAREGLVVIAAVMGVLGVGAGFLIHQRSPFTPWVLLGAVPAAVAAFWVLSPGAADSQESSEPSSASVTTSGDSCVSRFLFDGGAYELVLGPSVRSVAPGGPIGRGRFEPCAGASGDGVLPGGVAGSSRDVHAMPGVPQVQAVVLTTGPEGSVLISTTRPADGWDSDLQAFLDAAGSPERDAS